MTRRPFNVFAIFAAAFILHGLTLTFLQSDRPSQGTPESESAPVRLSGPLVVSNVFTVTSTADGGPGSLPQAVLDANNSPGLDEIVFDFTQPVTITLSSSLVITDAVQVNAPSPTITRPFGLVSIDGSSLLGDVFVISSTTKTSIKHLRLFDVAGGFGFHIAGSPEGTMIISNTVENAFGGVHVLNSGHITVTNNAFFDVSTGIEAENSNELWFQQNLLDGIGGVGIHLMDAVTSTGVISNSFSNAFNRAGAAIFVDGDPPPTGIVMRGNLYTDTITPIFLGPGANNDFPAPEIDQAFLSLTGRDSLIFSLKSAANPITYTYPLLIDLYHLRNSDYLPIGPHVMYTETTFPATFTYTTPIPEGAVLPTDELVVIATTFNPSTSQFSDPTPVEEVLPVELADFDALTEGDRVLLTWSTASESNNAGFEIHHGFERREESIWDVVGFVEGAGTTSEARSYQYEVDDLDVGRHRFRLKQIDFDGAFEFSPEIEAVVEVPGSHELGDAYPNPFNATSSFSVAVPTEQSVSVGLFDVSGRKVRTLFEGDLPADEPRWITIDGAGLASGLYVYRATGDSFSESKTVTLQK